jgi:hypothetical protein
MGSRHLRATPCRPCSRSRRKAWPRAGWLVPRFNRGMAMVLRLAPLSPADRMRIIEAHQPLAIPPMPCQRVVDTMPVFRRCGHPRDGEPDPMTPFRVHRETLPAEIEKHIQGGIAWLPRHIVIILKHRWSLDRAKPADRGRIFDIVDVSDPEVAEMSHGADARRSECASCAKSHPSPRVRQEVY